ncbi:MAG: hypothetical protein ACE5HE_08320 [Phycisphaerae bacterium]
MTDSGRIRVAVAILVIGVVLILWSWGNWVYRASVEERPSRAVSTQAAAPDAQRDRAIKVLPQVLAYAAVIVLVALFGGYALLRASRRYREAAGRDRSTPSAVQDVWAMHKTPPYEQDEEHFE